MGLAYKSVDERRILADDEKCNGCVVQIVSKRPSTFQSRPLGSTGLSKEQPIFLSPSQINVMHAGSVQGIVLMML